MWRIVTYYIDMHIKICSIFNLSSFSFYNNRIMFVEAWLRRYNLFLNLVIFTNWTTHIQLSRSIPSLCYHFPERNKKGNIFRQSEWQCHFERLLCNRVCCQSRLAICLYKFSFLFKCFGWLKYKVPNANILFQFFQFQIYCLSLILIILTRRTP